MIPAPRAMTNSTGKKIIKTGVKMVDKPKPEKKVSMAVTKAVSEVINISKAIAFSLFVDQKPFGHNMIRICNSNVVKSIDHI